MLPRSATKEAVGHTYPRAGLPARISTMQDRSRRPGNPPLLRIASGRACTCVQMWLAQRSVDENPVRPPRAGSVFGGTDGAGLPKRCSNCSACRLRRAFPGCACRAYGRPPTCLTAGRSIQSVEHAAAMWAASPVSAFGTTLETNGLRGTLQPGRQRAYMALAGPQIAPQERSSPTPNGMLRVNRSDSELARRSPRQARLMTTTADPPSFSWDNAIACPERDAIQARFANSRIEGRFDA
jgi:hypothetical protein